MQTEPLKPYKKKHSRCLGAILHITLGLGFRELGFRENPPVADTGVATAAPPSRIQKLGLYISQHTTPHNCLRGSLYVILQLPSLSLAIAGSMRASSFVARH